jgi:hypothetical protein
MNVRASFLISLLEDAIEARKEIEETEPRPSPYFMGMKELKKHIEDGGQILIVPPINN